MRRAEVKREQAVSRSVVGSKAPNTDGQAGQSFPSPERTLRGTEDCCEEAGAGGWSEAEHSTMVGSTQYKPIRYATTGYRNIRSFA